MAGERILVAEDDPVTARFLKSLLSDKGYRVVMATDGETAVKLALAEHPDLIVSDLVMPYKDGYSVLQQLRNEPRTADVPVVLLSMRDREEDIVQGLEQGADDYLVKPFNARELLVRIRKLIRRRREVC